MKRANGETKLKGIAFCYDGSCCHYRKESKYHIKGIGSSTETMEIREVSTVKSKTR